MADDVSHSAAVSVSYRVCSMRFLPQGHGSKMFVGGTGPEQSVDPETASGQARVVRREGLYSAGPIVLLDAFLRADSGDHWFLLRTKVRRLDEEMGTPGINS